MFIGNAMVKHGPCHNQPKIVEKEAESKKPNNSILISGEVCKVKKELLERSCVGTLKTPSDVIMVASKLAYPSLGISRILDIGRYKFLVTFIYKKDMKLGEICSWKSLMNFSHGLLRKLGKQGGCG